jgi:hypothetical protein
MLLVRPYPVARLTEARVAIAGASLDIRPIQSLYRAARDALAELDPDEVAEFRHDHPRAPATDAAAAQAALAAADSWEGVVAIGSTISDLRRFRAFAWLAAHQRYSGGARLSDFARYQVPACLPEVSPEDSALYAVLPALAGLGPELPEEFADPCPIAGAPVFELLGLPADGDYSGIDPLDGWAITGEALQSVFAALNPAWRAVASRALDRGLLVRPADTSE